MALLGLSDDTTSDGRVLVTDVNPAVLPASFYDGTRYQALLDLGNAYKQLNADVGAFGLATLAAAIESLLNSIEFGHQSATTSQLEQLTEQATRLIAAAQAL